MEPTELWKRRAGQAAAELVEDGLVLGLGTGSTVYWTLCRLGERIREEGLSVRGIPTSLVTERIAREQGIPLVSFREVSRLDLAIDGADEVTSTLDCIKGGGGALLREKLAAAAADRFALAVDAGKRVKGLGAFPLPVEVVPFAWTWTAQRISETGVTPRLRRAADGSPFVTDNGHYIVDCPYGNISDSRGLQQRLRAIPGVVETGLFLGMADGCIVGGNTGVEWLSRV